MRTKILPISQIDYGRNIRTERDEDIVELAKSIEKNGIITPLTVRPKNGRYEVVCGHRRWRAANLVEDDMLVPCVIIESVPAEDLEIMQIDENLQRKSMSAWELVQIFNDWKRRGKTQAQIAAMLGKTQGWVSSQYSAAAQIEKAYEAGNISRDAYEAKKHTVKAWHKEYRRKVAEKKKTLVARNGYTVCYDRKTVIVKCETEADRDRIYKKLAGRV